MKKLLWLVLIATAVLPRSAWAVDACEQDRPKVCGGVTPGKSAMHNCMLANVDKLSSGCRNSVQKSEQLVQQFMVQCKSDATRFCQLQMDTQPDSVVDCLRHHKDKFSAECKRIYKQFKAYDYPITE